MAQENAKWEGLEEFAAAIRRHPRKARLATGTYLKRATAVVLRETKKPAWRVGGNGGGTPEDTGNLRQAHRTKIDLNDLVGIIFVDTQAAKYGKWVHDGTSKMAGRPWLDYALEQKKKEVEKLQDALVTTIIRDLIK